MADKPKDEKAKYSVLRTDGRLADLHYGRVESSDGTAVCIWAGFDLAKDRTGEVEIYHTEDGTSEPQLMATIRGYYTLAYRDTNCSSDGHFEWADGAKPLFDNQVLPDSAKPANTYLAGKSMPNLNDPALCTNFDLL